MFTWLAQSSTMQSLRIALAHITFRPPRSRNLRPSIHLRNPQTRWKILHRMEPEICHTGLYYIAFTFDDITNIVFLDFSHSHFTLGDAVFVQKDGCPIGVYLSSPLAQIKCMCDEAVLIRTLLMSSLAKHFYDIRQIDNLLLLILADCDNELEMAAIQMILQAIRDSGTTTESPSQTHAYTGGLELEEAKLEPTNDTFMDFAGTSIRLYQNPAQGFNIRPLFKNWNAMMTQNRQPMPRLPPYSPYSSRTILHATIVGMLANFARQMNSEDLLLWATLHLNSWWKS
eukprot:g70674.t1